MTISRCECSLEKKRKAKMCLKCYRAKVKQCIICGQRTFFQNPSLCFQHYEEALFDPDRVKSIILHRQETNYKDYNYPELIPH